VILLITLERDEHTDLVIDHLTRRGAQFFRLNTDRLADQYQITYGFDGGCVFGRIQSSEGNVLDTTEVEAVWYRRVRCNPPANEFQDSHLYEFSVEEYTGFFRNLWITLDRANWMNPVGRVHWFQDHRLAQYVLATQCGLNVPHSVYTNNSEILSGELTTRHELAVKPIAQSFIRTVVGSTGSSVPAKGLLTKRMRLGSFSPEQLRLSCQNTPVHFQEYVPKSVEIRLTVVGDRMFPCEIDSQASDRTLDDWRRYDFKQVAHRACTLDGEIETRIRQFMSMSGLVFGAIDLILRPDGTYVFLEVNPAGQWHWIETMTGLPISEAIADWLLIGHQEIRTV
jgi:hypothetical protein